MKAGALPLAGREFLYMALQNKQNEYEINKNEYEINKNCGK